MAKRFTDSDKWRDPWFSDLTIEEKLFWLFILDTCDHAGIWKDQTKYFNYLNNSNLLLIDIITKFNSRIFQIGDSVYFIPKFISFQYPNFNPEKNNAHKGVIKSLLYNGAPQGLIEGLVCNSLNIGKELGAKEGLGRVTGIGIGIGLGIGIGKGIGIGTQTIAHNADESSSVDAETFKKTFFDNLKDLT
jgi:hypothetical protein